MISWLLWVFLRLPGSFHISDFYLQPMKTQKKRGRPKGEQPALTATERNQLRRQKNKDEGLVRIDCYVPDEVLKAVRDRYPDTIDKLITRGLKLLLSAKG